MKNYWKLITYVKKYKGHIYGNVLFNIMSVLFTLVSLTMLKPVMDLLFMNPSTDMQKFLAPNPHSGINREFVEYELNHFLADLILNHPDGLITGQKEALIFICILTAISFFFKNVFVYLSRYTIAPLRNYLVAVLREKAFKRILHLPNSYFTDARKGDIMSRMTSDIKEVEWGLVSLQNFVREPITIVVFLAGLIFIDIQLTLIVLLIAPVTSVVIAVIGKSLKRTSDKTQQKIGEVMSIFDETLTGLKIIKAFAVEKIIGKKFDTANDRFFQLSTRVVRKDTLASPLSEFLGISIFCTVLFVGGNRVFEGTFQGSTFTTFLLYLYGLITPIKAFSRAYSDVKKSSASFDRVEAILNADISIQNKENPESLSDLETGIEIKNVSFKYTEDWVLKNVSLSIQKGKSYALVGHSGSGKSTLADLIPRFQDVTEGAIEINGHDIRDVDVHQLRKLTGIVTQDSVLFNDSVRNNLTFTEPDITEEEIIQALKIANAYDFVMELPQGLDTEIGDGGGKLSGGQKQRLCIARAVLRNPPILILDEATSALDTNSEKLVQEALNNVMKNRTSIVIAHRLSTIKSADQIVVLDAGQIIEQGTHDELMEKKGAYAELVQMQNV
jgi:subfamily B ATP-binding cassette protein MsbA